MGVSLEKCLKVIAPHHPTAPGANGFEAFCADPETQCLDRDARDFSCFA
jgi:hypothetical protein